MPRSRQAELCVSSAFYLVLRCEPACQLVSQTERQADFETHTEEQNNHLALQLRPALRPNIQVNMANVSGTPLIKTLIVPFLLIPTTKSLQVPPYIPQGCEGDTFGMAKQQRENTHIMLI